MLAVKQVTFIFGLGVSHKPICLQHFFIFETLQKNVPKNLPNIYEMLLIG